MRPAQHGGGERDVASWALAGGDVLKLRLCNYKHREFIDLRRWYTDEAGDLKPSPRGIRFNSELAEPLAAVLTKIAGGEEAA